MEWSERAACKGKPLNIFFPQKGGSSHRAKSICRRCPVLEECRKATDLMEGVQAHGALHGIFGGESPKERGARRAAMRREAVEAAA